MTEEALDLATSGEETARLSAFDRFARRQVFAGLERLRAGSLVLVEGGERRRFGDPAAPRTATAVVEDPRLYRSLLLGGALGGCEAYLDGYWRTDDLTGLLRLLAADRDATAGLDAGSRWRDPALRAWHALRRNSRRGSRRNIAAHYDLGDDFFELFLDPTLTYSCGVFERPDASMEEASLAKYERVCRKLQLVPGDHVLEIGTGWGGFALHAATHYGCRVTTTTISERQYARACERIREAGLEDRVTVLFEDYRDLRGRYDKLVSIEMVEAVGHDHLEEFLRVCSDRLREDGAMLLQAITLPDRDHAAHVRSVDFIKRHIFPGGELVSVGALGSAVGAATDLRWTHLEDLSAHYAETLRRWRGRMRRNLPRMRDLGLDDRFLRSWELYLCYCEAGFDERAIGLVQAVLEKPGCRGPKGATSMKNGASLS